MSKAWTNEQLELITVNSEGIPLYPQVSVVADAGAGKTTVLVERVRRLSPKQKVLCVSFTEKSKADLQSRLLDLEHVDVFTIHGFCNFLITMFHHQIELTPAYSVLDGPAANLLFDQTFEKCFKRAPVFHESHRTPFFKQLCQYYRNQVLSEQEIEVVDLANKESGEVQILVQTVFCEFQATKRKRGLLEYNDLERFAFELLQKKEVCIHLAKRYQAVFVDEFQDTSRVQGILVRKLVFGKKTQLFIVGDPKQSIYRFRGAEVSVFREFTESLSAQKRLSQNYRSHPEVIEAVNKTFLNLMPAYQPMLAARIEKEPHFFKTETPLPRVAQITAKNKALAIVALLEQLKTQNISANKTALLLRRIKGNEDLFKELKDCGVSLHIGGSFQIDSNPNLLRLVHLWIWACEPWNAISRQFVLERFDLSLVEQFEKTTQPKDCYSKTFLLEKLDQVFSLKQKYGIDFESFRSFVLSNNYNSSLELAASMDHCLKEKLPFEGLKEVPFPAESEKESTSLKVLTIHASKGLEFPVVILADLEDRKSRATSFVAHENQVWIPIRDEKGGLDKTDLQPLLEQEKEAAGLESQRLLYVAMTRAEEALYFIELELDPEKKLSENSWQSWIQKAGFPKIQLQESQEKRKPYSKAIFKENKFTELKPVLFPRFEFKSVSEWIATQKKDLHLKSSTHFLSFTESLNASQKGTQVHRLFETQDWEALSAYPFYSWLQEDIQAKQIFGSNAMRSFEVPFLLEKENASSSGSRLYLEGRIDLLAYLKDLEQYWIIDFKLITNSISSEKLLATYAPQLNLYTEAVKKMTGSDEVRSFLLDIQGASGKFLLENRGLT